jgi:hypothetical protein
MNFDEQVHREFDDMILEQHSYLKFRESSNYYKLECSNEFGEVRANWKCQILSISLLMRIYEDLFLYNTMGKVLRSIGGDEHQMYFVFDPGDSYQAHLRAELDFWNKDSGRIFFEEGGNDVSRPMSRN